MTTNPLPYTNTTRHTAVYSVADFCTAYGVGRTYVYEQIGSGALKSKLAGRRRLILTSDAEQWWKSLPESSVKA
jgi:hypothetical protein